MSDVLEVNAEDWDKEVLQAGPLVIVDFWHKQCPWCLRLNPVYEEVAKEYTGKVKFAKLNVLAKQENREIAIKHGIMGTPTLIFFCEGMSIETATGFQPKEQLTQLVGKVLSKHQDCVKKSTKLKP